MKETIKDIAAAVFLILNTGWLLAHLIMIWLWDRVEITEPNQWVLWIEIVLASVILVLGSERLINKIKRND